MLSLICLLAVMLIILFSCFHVFRYLIDFYDVVGKEHRSDYVSLIMEELEENLNVCIGSDKLEISKLKISAFSGHSNGFRCIVPLVDESGLEVVEYKVFPTKRLKNKIFRLFKNEMSFVREKVPFKEYLAGDFTNLDQKVFLVHLNEKDVYFEYAKYDQGDEKVEFLTEWVKPYPPDVYRFGFKNSGLQNEKKYFASNIEWLIPRNEKYIRI